MTNRTTVAIEKDIKKKLKKLSAILDITQAEVIKRALVLYEKDFVEKKIQEEGERVYSDKDSMVSVQDILKNATKIIWAQDPERKALQQKLMEGPETIDDVILNEWDTGLI